MKRSGTVRGLAAAAALLLAGCGSGVVDESAATDDDFDAAVEQACASTDASNDLTDALCDDAADGTATTVAGAPVDGSTTTDDFIAEVDALCADTATTLTDDLSTAFGDVGDLAAVGDLDTLAARLGEVTAALDTLVLAYDDLEPPDQVSSSAVDQLIIYLGEFSSGVHSVQDAATAGDAQAVASTARAFSAPESDAAAAGAADLADLGASSCAALA